MGKARVAPVGPGHPGVASYRFDRRGVGDTPGDWRATGFFQHRHDAASVLRALDAQPEVSSVGAIGYSEGALHTAWLAAHAAAVVLLGCPAVTGKQVYLRWAARMDSDADMPPPIRLVLRLLGRPGRDQVGPDDLNVIARLVPGEVDTRRIR